MVKIPMEKKSLSMHSPYHQAVRPYLFMNRYLSPFSGLATPNHPQISQSLPNTPVTEGVAIFEPPQHTTFYLELPTI